MKVNIPNRDRKRRLWLIGFEWWSLQLTDRDVTRQTKLDEHSMDVPTRRNSGGATNPYFTPIINSEMPKYSPIKEVYIPVIVIVLGTTQNFSSLKGS